MKLRLRGLLVALAILSIAAAAANAQAPPEKRPITFQDLISMHRLGDPQISPDRQIDRVRRVYSGPRSQSQRAQHLDCRWRAVNGGN